MTGAGSHAMYHLTRGHSPPPLLWKAILEICHEALLRNVRLIIDAEQNAVQATIDAWTVELMRRYNKPAREPVVYNTYQAYLKAAPAVLGQHLSMSSREGFSLGVKVVRGAYLDSDPRHVINSTKVATDRSYDGIVESLIRGSYNEILPNPTLTAGRIPPVRLIVASHNPTSIRKAQEIYSSLELRGLPRSDVVYAQLLGMADTVSCELLQAGRGRGRLRVYKYVTWGSTVECMKYLHRRAVENRDATTRTQETRDALLKEAWRRIKSVLLRA